MGEIPADLDFQYDDNISLFLDPIPAKLLPELFQNNHPVWRKGMVMYEHIVDTRKLPEKIGFELVESVNKTKVYDEFVEKHHWYSDDPKLLKLWWKVITPLLIQWGEIGSNRTYLETAINKNRGRTTELYKKAVQRADFEENRNKYAANVPHLMMYPLSGTIEVQAINKITMGSDLRIPRLTETKSSASFESELPETFNW